MVRNQQHTPRSFINAPPYGYEKLVLRYFVILVGVHGLHDFPGILNRDVFPVANRRKDIPYDTHDLFEFECARFVLVVHVEDLIDCESDFVLAHGHLNKIIDRHMECVADLSEYIKCTI